MDKKVLIVEDDAALGEIYEVRLKNEGYEVLLAHDGEEALQKLANFRPDLVLTDVMMPKISGFDVLDIIRSTPETKDTKVIMMTALSGGEHRDRGENLGVNLYMVKSQAGIEDIVSSVNEMLGMAAPAPAVNPAVASIAPPTQPAAPPTIPLPPAPAVTPELTAPPAPVEPSAIPNAFAPEPLPPTPVPPAQEAPAAPVVPPVSLPESPAPTQQIPVNLNPTAPAGPFAPTSEAPIAG